MFTVWMIGLACSSHTVHHEAYGSSRGSSEVCARGVCSRYMPAPLRWTSTVNLYSKPLHLSIPSASPFSVCFYFWYFLNSNKISDEFLLGLRESANAETFWFWCNCSFTVDYEKMLAEPARSLKIAFELLNCICAKLSVWLLGNLPPAIHFAGA